MRRPLSWKISCYIALIQAIILLSMIMFDKMFYLWKMHGFKDAPAQIYWLKKMIEF